MTEQTRGQLTELSAVVAGAWRYVRMVADGAAGVLTIRVLTAVNTASNATVNLVSRSRITNLKLSA
jgi:hypothetical protein